MPNNSRILAIDPGTREMGVALLENGRLIYYGVKAIKGRTTPHETLKQARKEVLRLISDFKPQVLAFEKAFFGNNRNAAILNVFVDELRAIGKRKKLRVIAYAPTTVKKYICGDGHASKEEVARTVVAIYPELSVYVSQDRKWKERYHQNMFDAVALGMVANKWVRGL